MVVGENPVFRFGIESGLVNGGVRIRLHDAENNPLVFGGRQYSAAGRSATCWHRHQAPLLPSPADAAQVGCG